MDIYKNMIKIQEQLDHTYQKQVKETLKLKYYIEQCVQMKGNQVEDQVQKELDLAGVCIKLSELYRNMVGDF